MRRTSVGLFLLGTLMIGAFLTSAVNATQYRTIYSYYGHWGLGYFCPLNEVMNFDMPAANLVSPGPYPYVFTLNTTLHVYLQIRHFLWAYNENSTNHLTISVDNQTVLQAYSPRATFPNDWYPGGNGVQIIDLGMKSAGTHTLTMTCNISGYYTVNWWQILYIPSDPHAPPPSTRPT